MVTQTTRTTASRNYRPYHYYRCTRNKDDGSGACSSKGVPIKTVEPLVWEFVSSLLKDPERIRAGMEVLIDQEREVGARRPDEEVGRWAKKLEECDRLRSAYQDQQAAGLMTLVELGSKLEGLTVTRKLAEAELAALQAREKRMEKLERDRDALLEFWADAVPEALDEVVGEARNKVYRMLRLEVTPTTQGFDVTGALGGVLHSLTDTPLWRVREVYDLPHRVPGGRAGADDAGRAGGAGE